MTIKDFKGRIYSLIEVRKQNTLLECVKTNERITIRNNEWDSLGFIKP